MNKVILMGRLTRDPEVRYSQGASSTAVGRFSIAVDRRFKRDGEPDADFFNCTSFGKQAEFVEKYLKKGTKVAISGRIQNDNYEKDGVMHYSVQIICDDIEFAESKNASTGGGGNYQADGGFGAGARPAVTADEGDGFMNQPTGVDDELPFV